MGGGTGEKVKASIMATRSKKGLTFSCEWENTLTCDQFWENQCKLICLCGAIELAPAREYLNHVPSMGDVQNHFCIHVNGDVKIDMLVHETCSPALDL